MIECIHPEGRQSGQIRLMTFMVCDDCQTVIRLIPRQHDDEEVLHSLVKLAMDLEYGINVPV